jgi:hypothetical protein
MKSVTEPALLNVIPNKRLAKIMGFWDMTPCSLSEEPVASSSKQSSSEMLIPIYQTTRRDFNTHCMRTSLSQIACFGSQGSVVSSDWLRAGRLRGRSSSPGRVKNFLFSKSPRPALGSTQPPIQWVAGVHSLGVKRSGNEADHSPPPSAEVKKMCIYKSTPPYAFMV